MRKGLSASNLKGPWTNSESQPMEGLTVTTETAHKVTPGLLHRCHCMFHERDLGESSMFWFLLSWVLQANMLNVGICERMCHGCLGRPWCVSKGDSGTL